MQSFRFVFTINNPTDEDILASQMLTNKGAILTVFGHEVAPSTGTKHIQGYVEFHTKKRLSTVSKLLPRAYLATAKGTREQNIGYCTKGGDYFISDFDLALPFDASKHQVFNEYYSTDYLSQYKIRLDFYYNKEFFNNSWSQCLDYHQSRDSWFDSHTGKKYHHLKSNE